MMPLMNITPLSHLLVQYCMPLLNKMEGNKPLLSYGISNCLHICFYHPCSRYRRDYLHFVVFVFQLPRLPWWPGRYSVCPQRGRPRFDPWVGKIPWRREWQPTPNILAWRMLWADHEVAKSWTWLSDSHFDFHTHYTHTWPRQAINLNQGLAFQNSRAK